MGAYLDFVASLDGVAGGFVLCVELGVVVFLLLQFVDGALFLFLLVLEVFELVEASSRSELLFELGGLFL